jgi:cutinase
VHLTCSTHSTSTADMKTLIPTIFLSTLAVATPTRRSTADTSTDFDDVLANRKPCATNALVFGRGTFDSGNIGVWTGPQFKDALIKELDGDIHVQGVNREDYPANLDGYAREGGSESCADACAEMVDAYAGKCPEAKIFVSGWRCGLPNPQLY